MMIDTHCHLSVNDYDSIDEVIKNMGNNIMIVSGVDVKSNIEVIELCNIFPNIYGTVGYHPEFADQVTDDDIKLLGKWLDNSKIVGIGEIGLDYHYDGYNKEKQWEIFKKQLDVAKKVNKPVVIHSRDAIMDTYNILSEYKVKAVIHSFSASVEMANQFIDLGCMIGVGGVVTFKNAKKLQDVVSNIHLSKILLETDSPYLSPEPYRGLKNEPCRIIEVAKKIAVIKDLSVDEVLKITTLNAIKQFDLDIQI